MAFGVNVFLIHQIKELVVCLAQLFHVIDAVPVAAVGLFNG